MTTDPRIERAERLKELASKATPCATLTRYEHGGSRLLADGVELKLVADFYQGEDGEFYAAARNEIEALCDDLIALGRENAALKERERDWLDRVAALMGKIQEQTLAIEAAEASVQQGCEREAELVARVEKLSTENVRLKEKAEALEYGNGYLGEFLDEAISRAEAAERENARLRELAERMATVWADDFDEDDMNDAVTRFRAAYPKPDGENNAD